MKKIAILVLLSCIAFSQVSAQSEESKKDIKKLLLLMGVDKVSLQMMNNMTESFQKAMPNVPSKFWKEFMKQVDANEMIDLMVPIYAKHYNQSEIDQLIGFYSSPLGKKVTTTLPLITQESYKVGEQWGKKIGEKALTKLKEQGYVKDQK